MRFDLIDLRLFCAVADAGSITAGAHQCALALAAASTRIRNMEIALGASLLDRSRQGVTLTPAGRTLLKHARDILSQTVRMREDLSAYAGGRSGEVKLLANTNALTEFLPEALSAFLSAHPHVSVDLEERLSDEIVGLIAEGVGDVGIVAGTVDVGAGTVRGVANPATLRSDSHADASTIAPGVDDGTTLERTLQLVGDRWSILIIRAALRGIRRFDDFADDLGIARPILTKRLRRLVEAGVGIGVVPQTTARRAAKTMDLAVIGLTDDWAVRDLTIVVRAHEDLRPYARELVDSLRR